MIKRDKYGIIGQPNKEGFPQRIEGGDSMNWQAHMIYLNWLIVKDKVAAINLYRILFESRKHPGLYVRHPNPAASRHGFASYCEGNWRGVESRDQMTGKLCLFARAGTRDALLKCLWQHLKRGMIFANNTIHNGDDPRDYKEKTLENKSKTLLSFTWLMPPRKKHKLPDLTGPDIWALYIRGLRLWWLYPLLMMLDLHIFIDSIITRFTKENDVISHVLKVTTARMIMPTPLALLASKMSTKESILDKLKSYWTGWRSQHGMYALYVPYVERYWR